MAGMIDEKKYERIVQRIAQLGAWLEEEAPYALADQRHLEPHSPEQAYWHLGYHRGLSDMLSFLKERAEDSEGIASPSRVAGLDE
ncbi:MAG: hypothetical protein ACK4TL_06250 [Hyphomicrobiaceae bacterium]